MTCKLYNIDGKVVCGTSRSEMLKSIQYDKNTPVSVTYTCNRLSRPCNKRFLRYLTPMIDCVEIDVEATP